MKKLIFILILPLFYFNCSGDDSKEPCEDFYILALYAACEDVSYESILLSMQEGQRISDLINSSSEACLMINGVDKTEASFEGLIRNYTNPIAIGFKNCENF
jgi:hypothetical protein